MWRRFFSLWLDSGPVVSYLDLGLKWLWKDLHLGMFGLWDVKLRVNVFKQLMCMKAWVLPVVDSELCALDEVPEDVIEYPDGAPSELIREMKDADDGKLSCKRALSGLSFQLPPILTSIYRLLLRLYQLSNSSLSLFSSKLSNSSLCEGTLQSQFGPTDRLTLLFPSPHIVLPRFTSFPSIPWTLLLQSEWTPSDLKVAV